MHSDSGKKSKHELIEELRERDNSLREALELAVGLKHADDMINIEYGMMSGVVGEYWYQDHVLAAMQRPFGELQADDLLILRALVSDLENDGPLFDKTKNPAILALGDVVRHLRDDRPTSHGGLIRLAGNKQNLNNLFQEALNESTKKLEKTGSKSRLRELFTRSRGSESDSDSPQLQRKDSGSRSPLFSLFRKQSSTEIKTLQSKIKERSPHLARFLNKLADVPFTPEMKRR